MNRCVLILPLLALAGLTGCEEITNIGNAVTKEETAPPAAAPTEPQPVPTPQPGVPAAAVPQPVLEKPEAILARFQQTPAFSIDNNIVGSLVNSLEQQQSTAIVTTLALNSSQVDDAGLKHLAKLTSLRELSLSNMQKLNGSGLAELVALPGLEILRLDGSSVGDSGLEHVGKFPALKELYLSKSQVTDAGLPALQGLTKLEKLDLSYLYGQVRGGTFKEFRQYPPLVMLNLGETEYGINATVGELAGFAATLQELHLSHSQIGDIDLKGTNKLTNLKVLTLNANLLTDAGLTNLKGLDSLEKLYIAGHREITDRGLNSLISCKGLIYMDVSGSQMTFVELDKFYKKHKKPELQVLLNGDLLKLNP